MCNDSCIDFGKTYLSRDEVEGKDVIEIGAYNVNGSLRTIVERLNPSSYLGVDIAEGPGVDEICDINQLASRYGENKFDLIVCTEVFEHVRNWREGASNLKRILKAEGVLVLTTRSAGFKYHGYPHDYWRFEAEDISVIFGDLVIEIIEKDPVAPGVFMKARKTTEFMEASLWDYKLFSMVSLNRCRDITWLDIFRLKAREWRRSFRLNTAGGFKLIIKKITHFRHE